MTGLSLGPVSIGLFVDSLLTMAQIALALWLFARRLPQRPHFSARAVAVAVLIVAGALVGTWVGSVLSPELTGPYAIRTQFLLFSLILLACTTAVGLLYRASLWTSLFCATAGYTTQNLASGALGLYLLIVRSASPAWGNSVAKYVVAVGSTVVIYLVCDKLLASHLEGDVLVRVDGRKMLAMVGVVIALVIGFDTVNKTLQSLDVPIDLLVLLRIIHGIACAFVLAMEYELLYNRNLQMEVAVASRLMRDQEQRYRMSKENVDAINSKVHDMRHHVARMLAATSEGSDRELLQDVVRELNVYDSHIHTANEALDVVLTEKSLICERAGISFACIADGTALSHVSPVDLYDLFGTLLGPTIDSVRALEDHELWSVKLDVRSRAGMAVVHLECYANPAADAPLSAGDFHTAETIAARYGGTVSARLDGNVYQVNVMVPLAG